MTCYLATVLPGLESVAADEVAAKVPDATIAERGRGKLYFETRAAASTLLALRTVDNLFVSLGQLRVGPHKADLAALGRDAAELVGEDSNVGGTVWVNASRSGAHTFSRFEAADAVLAAVLRRAPRWRAGTAQEHAVELRLDVGGDRGRLARRMTDARFRFRGAERAFSPAALRPPVAHALVWLTRPQDADVFLDPFCGSGTVVSERAAYPATRIMGSDVSAAALAASRANVGASGAVELHAWDARRIPLEPRSVDAMATNLPFGRQVGSRDELPALYLGFAREAQRVLAPKGGAVVLTDLPELLLAAVEKTRLRAERMLTLSLKGLRPEMIRLSAP